jgi:cation transporter-like permease
LGGAALLAFAAAKVITRFRHPRWVGMRVSSRQLVLWSFLMASAHGAGLMLVPVLAGVRGEGVSSASAHAAHLGHVGHQGPSGSDSLLPALAAVGLHSAAMLTVAGVLAVVVYQKLGVEVLRRAWVNLDFIWVGALVVVGGLALGLGLWPVLVG